MLPLVRPADIPDAGRKPAREEAATDAEGTSLRDVWRASRARRRALAAEVKRFTVRQRRRRRVWIGVGAAFLVMVLGTAGAAYSPLFAVERIDVVGTSQLDAATVAEALNAQVGTPLAMVDDSAVKAALVRFPLVESYTLEARPPHDLVVNVVERTPIGALQTPAGFTVVDAAGVALSTTPDAPGVSPCSRSAAAPGRRRSTRPAASCARCRTPCAHRSPASRHPPPMTSRSRSARRGRVWCGGAPTGLPRRRSCSTV